MCWCLSYKSTVRGVASQDVEAMEPHVEGPLVGSQRSRLLALGALLAF